MASTGPTDGPPEGPPERAVYFDLAREYVELLFPGASPLEAPQPAFRLPGRTGVRERFLELQRRLAPLGLLPMLRMRQGSPILLLVPKPPPGRWAWQVNLLLFLLTIGTTLYAGYQQSLPLVGQGYLTDALSGAVAFSGSILFILGAHEMGHKLTAMRRGIDASLPYFLPMIPPVGTMGAVIATRTPAPDRDSLMDLGASGPIAGFIAAIPVLVYGVQHSFLVDPSRVRGLVSIPDPLLIRAMIRVLLDPPRDALVLGHPMLFAGWIGLVVTSVNLLPAGMLDGGHAVRAALGATAHRTLSYLGLALAVAMGFYPMAILIALLMRRGHAGPLDDLTPMGRSRRAVGVLLIGIFVLSAVTFTPIFWR